MSAPTTAHRMGSGRYSPVAAGPPRLALPRPLAALAVGAVLAVLGGCGDAGAQAEPGGSDPSTASPDVSASATPTPDPSAPAPADPSATAPAEAPALHVGGAIADFGLDAPAAAVVPYLTDLFGAEPEVTDDEVACVTSALPGKRLVWDGLTVLVRTTAEDGAATEPYVAGWVLDEHTGESPLGPLTTAEGLGLGDPAAEVTAAYPQAQEFDTPDASRSLWAVGTVDDDHTDDLTVHATDGVVTSVIGGLACGD